MTGMEISGWFGVRCIFRTAADHGDFYYEERVTVWPAPDATEAIRLAEEEAQQYASDIDAEYLGFAQSYAMADDLGAGAEVYSLIRTSDLQPTDYLTTYFDTGSERQTASSEEPAD